MASQSERKRFNASPETVWAAVQRAVGQTGWAVSNTRPGGFILSIPPSSNTNATTITIAVSSGDGYVEVSTSASCYGLGLFIDAPLMRYIRTFHNMVEVQVSAMPVRFASPPKNESVLLDDLERLARMRQDGSLSEEEFQAAKKKILV